MSESALLERPAETTADTGPDKMEHIYCARCAAGKPTAVSLCRAASKPTAQLILLTPGERVDCVVCDDLGSGAYCPNCNPGG